MGARRKGLALSEINSVFVSGNLTRDAELRRTASGNAVVNFGIAVNERKKNVQTGDYEDVPNFFDVVMWGKYAEAISGALVKGLHVTIAGKLQQNTWEREGQRRSKVEIVAAEVKGIPRRAKQQGGDDYAQQQADYASAVYDDDIPF